MARSHPHSHAAADKRAWQLRLRKIAGQIRSIEAMVGQAADCSEVLMQVVSVRKALKSFAEVVIHEHAHQCIAGASDPREGHRKLKEMLVVLQRYVD